MCLYMYMLCTVRALVLGFGGVEVMMVVRAGGVGELATARLMFTSAAASKYYYITIVQRYLYTHIHCTHTHYTVHSCIRPS